ncbi:Ku protein [Streptomyces sp. S186]|uniref:non-homologous end joining protein Ku n=1 Tax=Streptomyces sp. S186 TaxID=3434395 RepID=UPI003F67FDE1
MRPIWKGSISFSLVSVPVQLLAATEEHGPGLHEVHALDGGRIRHRKVCELDGREVAQHEIARGWEAPDGRTVVLDEADIAALPLPTKRVIDVVGFLDIEQVDPLMYSRPYWVSPEGASSERPYALMTEALARSGRLAVCKVAIRSRERLAVLRPRQGILVLQTLLWPEEIRDPGDLSSPSPVTDRELMLAEMLMDELAGVDIDQLHDEYAAALEQLVDAKALGAGLAPALEPGPVVDLMAALEESVRAARHARGDEEREQHQDD